MIPVLSAFYFGTIDHYRVLAQHPKVIIDLGEHYERQSYRNRTTVIGPNGTNDLVVPIARKSGEKMPMHQVGLSYAETWPRQHLHAIRSAYGKTPWYIHFEDDLTDVLSKRYDRLVELDLATMRLAMKWLGLGTELVVSEEYVESGSLSVVGSAVAQTDARYPVRPADQQLTTHNQYLDLRSTLHPKQPLPSSILPTPPYHQVFADRHGFVPRLSIIDLVCNCGRDARRIVLG